MLYVLSFDKGEGMSHMETQAAIQVSTGSGMDCSNAGIYEFRVIPHSHCALLVISIDTPRLFLSSVLDSKDLEIST